MAQTRTPKAPKAPSKSNSSSAVGRAGRAATPEQVEAHRAAKTAARIGYAAKRDYKAGGKALPYDTAEYDQLEVTHTKEMNEKGEDDVAAAVAAGWTPVPEMSDPERGKYRFVRKKEDTRKKEAAKSEQAVRMLYGAGSAGVGVPGAKVKENEFSIGGRPLPTSDRVGGEDALEKLMGASESTD